MAKIGLIEGFTLIPEGTHVFQITNVKYKEDFGKLEIYMQTQNGSKHIERFSLLKSDGSPNEGAYNAFSYFAKTALGNFDLTEKFKLEFRLEGYNLTNSVMPGNPNLTVTSTQFGGITSQVNYGREVQYTLRLHF